MSDKIEQAAEERELESMRRINEIRESKNIPIFKTLEQYLIWRDKDIEYDN